MNTKNAAIDLLPYQELIVLVDGRHGLGYNVIPANTELKGRLDRRALARAFQDLVRRHDALRAIIVDPASARPQQRFPATTTASLRFVDLSLRSDDEREVALTGWVRQAMRPFELATGPLVRATLLQLMPEHHVLLLSVYHGVVDGLSLDVLERELWTAYDAYAHGRSPDLEPAPSFARYAAGELEWLRGPEAAELTRSLRKELQTAPAALELPYARPYASVSGSRSRIERFALDTVAKRRLERVARDLRATDFAVLLGAFGVVLSRFAQGEDVFVISATAGVQRARTPDMVGPLLGRLALRTTCSPQDSFGDYVATVRRALGRGFQRSRSSLMDWLPAVTLPNAPTEAWLNVVPVTSGVEHETLVVTPFDVDDRTDYSPSHWLGMTLFAEAVIHDDQIEVILNSHADLFDDRTAARLLRFYRRVLLSILDDPSQSIEELRVLYDGPAGAANDVMEI